MAKTERNENFWKIRSKHYDKLFWVKNQSYIREIVRVSGFKKTDLVLDVGTGSGVMARAVKNHVRHVFALDHSESMLSKGFWSGISMIKWDISSRIFHDNLFDKVIARMVFHHIFENLDRTFLRCYDLLTKNGKLIVAEGIPPNDLPETVLWFTQMFKLKEQRRTFLEKDLLGYFKKTGFRKIAVHTHIMKDFSIKNWLENSGIQKKKQKRILDLHRNAPVAIKKAYKMNITKDDCFIDSKNLIIVGEK